jgi:phosphatidate cytidylyltransferase
MVGSYVAPRRGANKKCPTGYVRVDSSYMITQLYKRFLVSVILIVLLAVAIFSPSVIGSLTVVLIIAVSLSEFYNLVERKDIVISKKFGIALGSLIPVIVYTTSAFKFSSVFNSYPSSWEMVITILICFIIFVVRFTRKDSSQAIAVLSTTVFGILYISWPLSFIIKLLFLPSGKILIVYLLLVTKTGDMGAYLVGSRIGKHSLIKRISPSKSKEGTLGGLVFSIISSLIIGVLWLKIEPWQCIVLGFVLGSLAQLGDLCESLLKRDCQVKDSGKLFPELGGMLDLVDSIIFAAPLFYLYVSLFLK